MKRAARQGGPRGHLRLRFHGNASQLPVICLAPSSAAWTLELMAFRAQLGRGRWNPNLDTSSLLRNRLTPQPLEVTLRAKRMKSSSTARVCGSWGYDGPAESPAGTSVPASLRRPEVPCKACRARAAAGSSRSTGQHTSTVASSIGTGHVTSKYASCLENAEGPLDAHPVTDSTSFRPMPVFLSC